MGITMSTHAMPSWARLIRLNLGMTLLGLGAGLSFPFMGDLLAWGPGSHGLSIIALFGTVPMTGAGILLAASACGKSLILK